MHNRSKPMKMSKQAAANKAKNNSSNVAAFLNPKAPKHTRNHMAVNRQNLRELEMLAAARKEIAEMEAVPQNGFTLSRFGHAESKLAAMGLGRTVTAPAIRGSTFAAPLGGSQQTNRPARDFLRKTTWEDPTTTLPKAFVREEIADRKASVPKSYEVVKLPPRQDRDYLHANAVHAITVSPKRRPGVDPAAPEPKHEEYGAVPSYLRDRKATWAQDEAAQRKKAEEEAACPKGHRLLPEEERVETLDLLKKSLAETRDNLSRMPLRVEIPSALRKLADMEAKLKKLEDAVALFSKPRVYVKLGA